MSKGFWSFFGIFWTLDRFFLTLIFRSQNSVFLKCTFSGPQLSRRGLEWYLLNSWKARASRGLDNDDDEECEVKPVIFSPKTPRCCRWLNQNKDLLFWLILETLSHCLLVFWNNKKFGRMLKISCIIAINYKRNLMWCWWWWQLYKSGKYLSSPHTYCIFAFTSAWKCGQSIKFLYRNHAWL